MCKKVYDDLMAFFLYSTKGSRINMKALQQLTKTKVSSGPEAIFKQSAVGPDIQFDKYNGWYTQQQPSSTCPTLLVWEAQMMTATQWPHRRESWKCTLRRDIYSLTYLSVSSSQSVTQKLCYGFGLCHHWCPSFSNYFWNKRDTIINQPAMEGLDWHHLQLKFFLPLLSAHFSGSLFFIAFIVGGSQLFVFILRIFVLFWLSHTSVR